MILMFVFSIVLLLDVLHKTFTSYIGTQKQYHFVLRYSKKIIRRFSLNKEKCMHLEDVFKSALNIFRT